MVYNLHFVCKLHEPITVPCTVCRQVCDMEEDILKDNTIAATVLRSSTSKYFSTVCYKYRPNVFGYISPLHLHNGKNSLLIARYSFKKC